MVVGQLGAPGQLVTVTRQSKCAAGHVPFQSLKMVGKIVKEAIQRQKLVNLIFITAQVSKCSIY